MRIMNVLDDGECTDIRAVYLNGGLQIDDLMPVKLALSERVRRGSSVQYISVCFLISNNFTMGEAWVSLVLSTLFVLGYHLFWLPYL